MELKIHGPDVVNSRKNIAIWCQEKPSPESVSPAMSEGRPECRASSGILDLGSGCVAVRSIARLMGELVSRDDLRAFGEWLASSGITGTVH